MWFIVGYKGNLELIKDGKDRVIHCTKCDTPRMHFPYRHVKAATAFFVPVANFSAENVYVCDGCGQQVARAEDNQDAKIEQEGTFAGQLLSAFEKGGEMLRDGIERGQQLVESDDLQAAWTRGSDVIKDGIERGQKLAEELLDGSTQAEAQAKSPRDKWLDLLTLFAETEPDDGNRERAWRSRRARYPGEVRDLADIHEPGRHDEICLRALIVDADSWKPPPPAPKPRKRTL